MSDTQDLACYWRVSGIIFIISGIEVRAIEVKNGRCCIKGCSCLSQPLRGWLLTQAN